MIDFLIQNGADIHSTTPNGDSVLHLAISGYVEGACWDLMRNFIEAGCNLATCNSEGKTILEAAIGREYTSVVELLISYNAPLAPDVLSIALRCGCTPQMIQLLVRKGANECAASSSSDREALFRLVRASYSGQDRQQVIEILDAARQAKRTYPTLGDEALIHAAKRPRLE